MNCDNNYNYFSTKEKAEEVKDEQLLYRMMKKFYDKNDGKVDLNDEKQEKHYIKYNVEYKEFNIDSAWRILNLSTIYFSSEKLAKRCLEGIVKPFYEKYPKFKN